VHEQASATKWEEACENASHPPTYLPIQLQNVLTDRDILL